MAKQPTIKVEGAKELIANLKRADKKIQKRVLTNAIKASGKPIIKAARSNAPIRTGTLAKSLGSKAKSYNKGNTKAIIIGPRASIVDGYQGKVIRPVNYAHLVEKGFNNVKAGAFIQGTNFIEKAYDSEKNGVQKSIETALIKGIEKETAKGNIRA
jgi:HK97 gp10 family phage protein